jgi:flagellum-specific peptidoglycan hydrolase FlgJ
MNKIIFIVAVFVSMHLNAQRTTQTEYIEQYKQLAMEEMKRSGVPAAITLAQGILESESGNSELAVKANNHFGIKCKETWTGETIYHDDDHRGECFRKYPSAEESYRDHSDFLKFRPYYTSLFALDPSDYKAWAKGLKKAGYATGPNYANQLIDLIERFDLNRYSMEVINASVQQQPE